MARSNISWQLAYVPKTPKPHFTILEIILITKYYGWRTFSRLWSSQSFSLRSLGLQFDLVLFSSLVDCCLFRAPILKIPSKPRVTCLKRGKTESQGPRQGVKAAAERGRIFRAQGAATKIQEGQELQLASYGHIIQWTGEEPADYRLWRVWSEEGRRWEQQAKGDEWRDWESWKGHVEDFIEDQYQEGRQRAQEEY